MNLKKKLRLLSVFVVMDLLLFTYSSISIAGNNIRVENPFTANLIAGSIEKAAFDYAMVAKTQNVKLLSYFYTKAALNRPLIKDEFGKNTWFMKADYSRHLAIELEPQKEADTYVVFIEYYYSEKFPMFQTLFEMKRISDEWEII